MSNFNDRVDNAKGLGLRSIVGLTLARVFLLVWAIAIFVVVVVPTLLVFSVVIRAARWLVPRTGGRPCRPVVIEGKYRVLNS